MRLLTSHQGVLVAEGIVLLVVAGVMVYLLLQASGVLYRLLTTNDVGGWRRPGDIGGVSWRLPAVKSGTAHDRLRKAWRPQQTAFR